MFWGAVLASEACINSWTGMRPFLVGGLPRSFADLGMFLNLLNLPTGSKH